MTRFPRLAVASLVAAGLVLAACGGDDDTSDGDSGDSAATTSAAEAPEGSEAPALDGTLTVYSGRGEDLVGPLLDLFEETTGIDTEVRYGDSAEMLLLIQEEGDNSPADVYYSQGAGFLGELSATGAFSPLPEAVLAQVPEGLRSPQGDWVGLSGRARTVVFNTEELAEEDLPASILDYTDPAWAGRIGYAPTNASFQDFVTSLRATIGEDETRAWLEGLLANGIVPFENNTSIVEGVAAGEVSVGFVNHYYLYRFLAEDPAYPAANHFSPEGDPGALVNIAGAGILATTDVPAEAEAFMAFLLSPEAQQYFAEQTFEIPVIEEVETPADLPSIASISLPAFDLNELVDLQGTIDLLTEVGAL
jgi:iron(III) transport system substrate-binding protein